MAEEPDTFTDTIRNRLVDKQQAAREALFPPVEPTEPEPVNADQGEKNDG